MPEITREQPLIHATVRRHYDSDEYVPPQRRAPRGHRSMAFPTSPPEPAPPAPITVESAMTLGDLLELALSLANEGNPPSTRIVAIDTAGEHVSLAALAVVPAETEQQEATGE
jgi:hypothetical protein